MEVVSPMSNEDIERVNEELIESVSDELFRQGPINDLNDKLGNNKSFVSLVDYGSKMAQMGMIDPITVIYGMVHFGVLLERRLAAIRNGEKEVPKQEAA